MTGFMAMGGDNITGYAHGVKVDEAAQPIYDLIKMYMQTVMNGQWEDVWAMMWCGVRVMMCVCDV